MTRQQLLWAGRVRSWLRGHFGLSHLKGILLWPGIIGCCGALITVAFGWLVEGLVWLLTGRAGEVSQVAQHLSPWQRLGIPLLGSLLAGCWLHFGTHWVRGRPTTDYMEAVSLGDGLISVRASLVRSASSICTIGTGGSIGREGAMVQLAALVGSLLGRIVGFPPRSRRLLVACGAAAGIAAAYNAPLAASIFVSEILLGSLDLESMGPIIVAAVLANATLHGLLGYAPVYQVPDLAAAGPEELLLYLLLGCLAGPLAPAFLWLLEGARRLFQAWSGHLILKMVLGGLGVGGLATFCPDIWGNGYGVVNSILHQPWTWQALLLVLPLKLLATTAMVGSGAVGGVFTPTLFCGAVLGALLATLAGASQPAAYAVVGMGAFLGATTHAPLMAILMVVEMTGQYQLVLPLMLATVVADHWSRRLGGGRSIYAQALRRPQLNHTFRLLDLLRSQEPTLEPEFDLAAVRRRFSQTTFNSLAVVDEQGRWLGIVARRSLVEAPSSARAQDLLSPNSGALVSSMTFQEALGVAASIASENLSLVEGPEAKYLGVVTKSDLLAAVHRHLRRWERPL